MVPNPGQSDLTPFPDGVRQFIVSHFDRYFTALVRFGLRHQLRVEDAEDIAMHAIEQICKSAHPIENETHLNNYLYRAARHRILNLLRDRDTHSLSLDSDKATELTDPDAELFFDKIEYHMLVSILNEIINALPEKAGKVFKLKLIDRLDRRDIARELNIAPSTVSSHIREYFPLVKEKFIKALRDNGLKILLIILLINFLIFLKISHFDYPLFF